MDRFLKQLSSSGSRQYCQRIIRRRKRIKEKKVQLVVMTFCGASAATSLDTSVGMRLYPSEIGRMKRVTIVVTSTAWKTIWNKSDLVPHLEVVQIRIFLNELCWMWEQYRVSAWFGCDSTPALVFKNTPCCCSSCREGSFGLISVQSCLQQTLPLILQIERTRLFFVFCFGSFCLKAAMCTYYSF